MTSEVVVMNRAGVALAADSAVTVEMGDSQRVRHSALKLFTLSKYRPVGVMVYNNASLLGVPMETIIKLFRRRLGKKAYRTLREYGGSAGAIPGQQRDAVSERCPGPLLPAGGPDRIPAHLGGGEQRVRRTRACTGTTTVRPTWPKT